MRKKINKRICFSLTVILSVFFLSSSCKKEKSFSENCNVVIEKRAGSSTGGFYTYDLNNRLLECFDSLNQVVYIAIEYSGDSATAISFNYDDNVFRTVNATINSMGNIVSMTEIDTLGNNYRHLIINYNSDNKPTEIYITYLNSGHVDTLMISWTDGNATQIIYNQDTTINDYYLGQTSSIKYGAGNAILLGLSGWGYSIATIFSDDLIKTYGINIINNNYIPLHFSYEFDNEGKVIEMIQTPSNGNNTYGTEYNYECD